MTPRQKRWRKYAKRLGNGAVFKRLGFLAHERQGRDTSFVSECQRNMTKSSAKLDLALASPRLVGRWRLCTRQAGRRPIMIERHEIMAAATDRPLAPEVVEKDHVLGWVLAGIYADERLAPNCVFKGGTCLEKCYFETYAVPRTSTLRSVRRRRSRKASSKPRSPTSRSGSRRLRGRASGRASPVRGVPERARGPELPRTRVEPRSAATQR